MPCRISPSRVSPDVAKIELDKQARETLGRLLKTRLKDEHELEIESFDALDLVDYLSETFGPYFYNQGLADAQAILTARVETITDAIYDLEQPVQYR